MKIQEIIKGKGSVKAKYGNELVDQKIRDSHKLNFQSKSIAGHHLISNSVIANLSDTRRYQLIEKGWSLNHGYNILILPSIPSIACHFNMPCHETGYTHVEHVLFNDFYSNKRLKGRSTAKTRKTIKNDEQDTILKTKDYHKVVATELAIILKGITCKTDYIKDVENIDDLSLKLSNWISNFQLLLTPNGKNYSSKHSPMGCGKCDSASPKKHFSSNDRFKVLQNTNSFVEPNSAKGYLFDANSKEEFVIAEDKKNKGSLIKYKIIYKKAPDLNDVNKTYREGARIITVKELMDKL